jgi:fructose-specific component phosphotransferase system IIB-like protein
VATLQGMSVMAAAREKQEIGRRGDIVGPQIIGLMGSGNAAGPEEVLEGQTISLADNARAQNTSERVLCRQMAEQTSAVVSAASTAASN